MEVIGNTSGGHVDYMRKSFRLHLEVFQITYGGYLDYTWPGLHAGFSRISSCGAPREEMRLKPDSTCGNLAQREVFEYSEAPARPQYPTGYCERAGAFEYTEISRCATSRL